MVDIEHALLLSLIGGMREYLPQSIYYCKGHESRSRGGLLYFFSRDRPFGTLYEKILNRLIFSSPPGINYKNIL
jgi:hypothetical protein